MLDINGKLNKVPTLTRLAYIARYYIGGAVVSICRHLFDYSVVQLGAKLSLKKETFVLLHNYDFQKIFLKFQYYYNKVFSLKGGSLNDEGQFDCLKTAWQPLGAVHKLCCLKIGDFLPPPPFLVVFSLSKIGMFDPPPLETT